MLLLWAIFGELDIIVNAQGRVIPSERTKSIAAVEVASVRALHVRESQVVQAGDLLIELDARSSDAEADKALGEWQSAALQAARARALLDALMTGTHPRLSIDADVTAERRQDAERHLVLCRIGS